MSSEFSRVKKDIIASTITAQSVKADRAEVDVLEVLNDVVRVVNVDASNSPVGAIALGPTGTPAAVTVAPENVSFGYNLVGSYTSATPADDRFLNITLQDATLVAGNTYVVSSTPAATITPTPANGEVEFAIEFTEVSASGAYSVSVNVVRTA